MAAPESRTFDPDDSSFIREQLTTYLSERVGEVEVAEGPDRYRSGLDTYVYAIRFAGSLPEEWTLPLVLRVYPSPEQAEKAEREAAVQTFVAQHGFPAPRPLLVESAGAALGLPFMIMERCGGSLVVGRFKNPFGLRRVVREMAALQARLHMLPVEGCPLPYDSPLVDRWLAEPRDQVSRFHPRGLDVAMRWLEVNAAMVRQEEPALLHNDFHPLNILADGERMTLLDWSDAALGDRHCDVARTLALLWLAAPLEKSLANRTALRLLRRYLVPLYEREYRSHLPLDARRLRYWEALHAFRAWAQIAVMRQEGESAIGARSGVSGEIPPSVLPALREYVRVRMAGLSQHPGAAAVS